MAEQAQITRSTTDWQALDAAHQLHPFSDHNLLAQRGARIISRGEGIYLWDSDGHRILDGLAGICNVALGYGREELVEAAARQMRELAFYNHHFGMVTTPSIELAEKLAELTPSGLNHVFFASSGSEALDTVVRLIRHYWNLKGEPDRKTIIGREFAYHGSTMATISLGGMAHMQSQADLPLPGFEHVTSPYWFADGGDFSPDEYGLVAARALEAKINQLGADKVAAFVAEPVQGAGGGRIPPDSYWPEIKRICREYGILFVVDEVLCGFGRTGNWFGCQTYDLQPDMLTFAKSITSGYVPLSGVMIGERVADALFESGGAFYHGFTNSGHPVACAVALENIRILQDEKIIERVRNDTGPYLAEKMGALAGHPMVGEVRSVGFLGAIELVSNKATRERFDQHLKVGESYNEHCIELGLTLREIGDTILFAPPLIMTREQIDEMADIAARALDITAQEFNVA
ncbi:MAG: aspartate aminotransferase family protein [Proteobacteria bacterium]|nr:aspartate aminotransferase family protein [Pseudomonadota bacterium]